jgi:hypothetical protein
LATPVFATSNTQVSVEYLPDGSYIETVIEENQPPFSLFIAASTTSGNKTVTYRNSSGEALWYVRVTGYFSYNGSTATCTSASVSAASYSSAWGITSQSSSYSGNTAYAYATAKQYLAGVVILTVNESVQLTCSASGGLS